MSANQPEHPEPLSVQHAMDSACGSLVEEFAGIFAAESVATCLTDSYHRLLPASVSAYLPLLAHRFARERLRAASRASGVGATHGAGDDGWPLVLFVCTANSGRSQLASALLAHRAAGSVEVSSAGTHPASQVQPEVGTALAEIGIDPADLFPKPLTDEVVAAADVVVTMGCGDSCPVLPGRRYLDWGVMDPAGLDLDTVRSIRDDINHRVTTLLDELSSHREPNEHALRRTSSHP